MVTSGLKMVHSTVQNFLQESKIIERDEIKFIEFASQ